jgi:hypothetical protein
MSEFSKALSPDEPQTIDGYRVTGLQKSIEKPMIFGMCWKPDPRGYGIFGAMKWFCNGQPSELGDPELNTDTIPDHLWN